MLHQLSIPAWFDWRTVVANIDGIAVSFQSQLGSIGAWPATSCGRQRTCFQSQLGSIGARCPISVSTSSSSYFQSQLGSIGA